jgi:ERCC4-type nuclease
MRIVVDVHERASNVASLLTDLGCETVVRRLAAGDYEVADGVVVERKTIADFRASLADGRLWPQVGRLRVARVAYLVVEGPDVLPALRDADALRSAMLAISDAGVIVIRSRDRSDTAAWLKLIARRRKQQPIRQPVRRVGRPSTPQRAP